MPETRMEAVDPVSGEIVDLTDTDAVIAAVTRCNDYYGQLYAFKAALRGALVAVAEFPPDKLTCYVRGDRHRAKLTKPDISWDQKILKDVAASYPKHAESVLRVSAYAVILSEYGKVEKESGPRQFTEFRALLLSANRGRLGLPTVKVED